MVYTTLMFTGLRYNEMRPVTIGRVRLDADTPHIELPAANEKARRGAVVALPKGLAERCWPDRRRRLVGHCSASVVAFPGALDNDPLFDLPTQSMIRVFDADLKAAKIDKHDAQGRVLDIHSLRHSYCTLVAQSGVNMQTAQRLMRHASPQMTMKYTHLTLTDLGQAIAALPMLPQIPKREAIAAVENTSNLRPLQRPHIGVKTCQKKGIISHLSG